MVHHQPPLEEIEGVVIDECITNPQIPVILPHDYRRQNPEDPRHHNAVYNMTVDVVNINQEKASQAYMRIKEMPPIDLGHHYPEWGTVYFGVILPRVGEGVYHLPTEKKAQKVAIKRLSRASVNEYLERGGNENPYKEIQRMQWLGDNKHVLGLVEALHDEKYLYIIMPYCEGGSLAHWSFSKRDRIHEQFGSLAAIYLNVLENIEYLHSNGVCHRDLSPDNCMVLRNGRIVFVDLAMSFRIPPGDLTTKIGRGFFGKSAYLPPEVVSGFHYFGARASDLWSSAVILFNLATGELAWEKSLPNDLRFNYLVMAGGLSRIPVNERTIELLDREPAVSELRRLAEKCLDLNPSVSDLLDGILKLDPNQRFDTNQAKKSIWLEAFRQLQ